jgi:hypothetical protein
MVGPLAPRLSTIGFVLASLPIAVAAWLPFDSRETVTVDSNGVTTFASSRLSLIESQGWTVLIPLVIPAVLTVVPVVMCSPRAAQRARVAVAVLLGIGVLLAMASVGMFYVPALGFVVAAAVQGRDEHRIRPMQRTAAG